MCSLKKVSYFLIFISFGLISVYLIPSGLPQISDFLFLLSIVFGVFYFIKVQKGKVFFLPAEWSALLFIVCLVSVFWSIYLQDINYLHHPLFWIYNYFVCTLIYNLFKIDQDYFPIFLLNSIFFAVAVSTLGVLFFSDGVRFTGFFNNPNQLGFFSLLSLVMILLIKDFKINKIMHLIFIMCSLIGVLLSASLAATISIVFILMGYLYSSLSIKKILRFFLIIPILVMGVYIIGGESLINNIETRFNRFDTKLDSVESERNYERIYNNLEYTLIGAAEGGYHRFSAFEVNEIHSSFGNIFFSYGVMGLVLFLLLLYRILKGLSISQALVFFAPIFYSLTHMGLRTTYFWIFIVVCLMVKEIKNNKDLHE